MNLSALLQSCARTCGSAAWGASSCRSSVSSLSTCCWSCRIWFEEKTMFKQIRAAVTLFLMFTLITGFAYPAMVTGMAQLLFPAKANGSLIMQDGKVQGSALIGQPFSDPRYFWGRLSATSPFPYNPQASSGSNLGPTNP